MQEMILIMRFAKSCNKYLKPSPIAVCSFDDPSPCLFFVSGCGLCSRRCRTWGVPIFS